jgi:hypothetical protein
MSVIQQLQSSGSLEVNGPCPACGYTPAQAPEGTDGQGNPFWNFQHCFKCGFRSGVNTAVDQAALAKAFDAFKAYVAENIPGDALGIKAASENEIATLQAQLAQSQAVQAQLRAQLGPAAQPSIPTTSAPGS